MCGIYGIAKTPTPYTKKQLKLASNILREIAIDSETRGSHSSGIAKVGLSTRVYKSLLPSSKFVKTKDFKSALKSLKDESTILLGHTRFATDGAIVKTNAHPFRIGDVVGAHNGCVYNIEEMKTKLDKQCPVDSQLIFKSINESDNIQDAVKYFDSDFALSFVKNNPFVLHLCRESNRPLYVAYIPSLQTLYYASEEGFIDDALDKYNTDGDIFSLNTNTLYSFDVNKFTSLQTNVDKVEFEYESRVYQRPIYNYVGTTQYNMDDDTDWATSKKESVDNEAQYLSEIYGGKPEEWFFDDIEQEWFYLDENNGLILSEEQVATQQYYDNEEVDYDGYTKNV